MAPAACEICRDRRAAVVRPKNAQKICKACFVAVFEAEIHETIMDNGLFQRGERVAIGASGGKDSTVLASVLKTLNDRHDYGLDLVLLSIDEGIKGYRDDSLATVKRNAQQYGMPLEIVGYDRLYGWTMDQVVAQVGKKGNCTYCGVFRRQALDRGAAQLGITHVVTGHNADDLAETVMMNLLRGDLPRLARATAIVTSSAASAIKRSKPLKYAYEKEIVLYAYHQKLDYFSTECIYSPEAFRGSARALVKDLEKIRPSSILDIVKSGEDMATLVPPEVSLAAACGAGAGEGEARSCGPRPAPDGSMTETETTRQADAAAAARETEITLSIATATATQRHGNDQGKDRGNDHGDDHGNDAARPRKKAAGRRKVTKQLMGQCIKCGYMSSQATCKACSLLDGLNKNRPHTQIEVGIEDEEGSKTLARELATLAMSGAG